jgi:hypothetical protein
LFDPFIEAILYNEGTIDLAFYILEIDIELRLGGPTICLALLGELMTLKLFLRTGYAKLGTPIGPLDRLRDMPAREGLFIKGLLLFLFILSSWKDFLILLLFR